MGEISKDQRCPYCLNNDLRPKGWTRKSRKRRYKCKSCKKHITLTGQSWFIDDRELGRIDRLLVERISLRGICRSLEISLSWLMAYCKRLYKEQPDDLNYHPNQDAEIELKLVDTELDEMWSFVGNKKNKKWIWIAQCRATRQVIAFHVGGRGKKDAKMFWEKIPEFIQKKGYFYSDDWDAYKGVFTTDRHYYSKQKKETNHLERLNNTIRQRVSRLVRKALSFSKSEENHKGALKYFFCKYNLELQGVHL